MKIVVIFVLISTMLTACNGFSASAIMKIPIRGKSLDDMGPLRSAVQMLNVTVPENWANLMEAPSTSGAHGREDINTSSVQTVISAWSVPDQFRDQAIKSVQALMLASAEGSFSTQTFTFDIPAGTSLTTLLVAVTKMHSPTDPDKPYVVVYVTMNTNAAVKQQYSHFTERVCRRCASCVWLSKCCCHNEPRSSPRGHTLDELNIVRQKMTSDQYIWFNQQNISSHVERSVVKRAASYSHKTLDKILENFISKQTVKDEVLTSYNDSVLKTIQSYFTILKLSTQVLKLYKVDQKNLPNLITAVAKENGFDDFYSNPKYSEQIKSPRFSYEQLYTVQSGVGLNHVSIKYAWVIVKQNEDSTCDVNFLSLNISSQSFLESILSNKTNNESEPNTVEQYKQLNIARLSTFALEGDFFDENLLASNSPWDTKTTQTVLNMLRFIAASASVPQKFKMVSNFGVQVFSPGTNFQGHTPNQPRFAIATVTALATAVTAVADAAKSVIGALKSSTSVTIERIVRFGFKQFSQRSTILKALNIPSERVTEFINAITIDYNLPTKSSFFLGVTYSSDFAWEQTQIVYSPNMDGNYNSLTLFKNGDSTTNTASFFIIDIKANWTLAPDLLIITTSKSKLGGFISSSKQEVQEIPHALTLDEAQQLQQFFMLIAIGNIAKTLQVSANFTSALD